jgi:hypothetical protein
MDGVQSSFADGGDRLNRRQIRPQSRAVAGLLSGVTEYRNTRFFGGSNRRALNAEDAGFAENPTRQNTSAYSAFSAF